jgi:hypothetical protein
MNLLRLSLFLFLYFLINACKSNSQTEENHEISDTVLYEVEETNYYQCDTFNRDSLRNKIKLKRANKLPLIVHIFVPLCDNEHQGIVPVNNSLGNGMNLKTNLYWGAGYGIKTHFKRKTSWRQVFVQKDIDTNILERIVFTKQYDSQTKVILIADAYRGDRMESCMRDYFNSLAGLRNDAIYLPNDTINLKSKADLLIFNGHNGLMDVEMEYIDNMDGIEKDAAIISCVSANYFMERLKCLKAYPLVTTQELLPPEAYIAEGIIDAWAMEKNDEEIRLNAGNAMFKVFKRNQKAMQGIFRTGW